MALAVGRLNASPWTMQATPPHHEHSPGPDPAGKAGAPGVTPGQARWRLSDVRIGTRLRLSHAVLLTLTLGMAGVSVYRLGQLSEALAHTLQAQQQALARVDDVTQNAEVAARKLLVLIGAPRDNRVAAYTVIDAAHRRLDEAVAALARSSQQAPPGMAGAAAAFLTVSQRLAAFRADYAATVDLIEADDLLAARRLLGGRTEASLTALTEALAAYRDLEQQALTQRAQQVRAQVQRDQQLLVGLCVLALGLGVVLSGVVSCSIVRPLRRTQDGALRIASGHYDHRVPDCAADEVGMLGRSLNQLARAVGEREAARVEAAETETLTQLPRRARFLRHSEQQLAALQARGRLGLLVCLDLDRLKGINAVLGFQAGDALLQAVAQRLREQTPSGTPLGRLSGGAFVALLEISDASEADRRLAQLHASLEHRLDWRGQPLDVAVTLGGAVHPVDCSETDLLRNGLELLLRRAEAAMYEAKRSKLPCMRFSPQWERARASQFSLLSALREAVDQGQLRQVLQPKVDPVSGALRGAEALVRWQHPTHGFMNPAEFIPFAEQTGRIRDLTRWMLRRALHNLAHMPALAERSCYLAVNISTLDLADADLPGWLAGELARAGVAPQRLQLEVTESGLLAAGNGPIEVLTALREVGVSLALDDFGTGQSSLAYLQRLPVQELKIDRSFVDKADLEPRRQLLLQAIIDLGHSLALTVTAEGVETAGEMVMLQRAGVDLEQGYHVSRPLDEAGFAARYAPAQS